MLIHSYPRIDISSFIQDSQLIPGTHKVEWKNGNSIGVKCIADADGERVILFYNCDGESYNVQVNIISVPSNLGRGVIRYFECPDLGVKCKSLYIGRGVKKWTSRRYFESIGLRLYYPTQLLSERDYMLRVEHKIEAQIDKIYSKKLTLSYAGKKTRTAKKLERLHQLQERCNDYHLMKIARLVLPKRVRRSMIYFVSPIKR